MTPPPSAPSSAQVPLGDSLGPYKLVRMLGRGGMGAVWEAVDTRLDRRVALKVVLEREDTSPEELERFRNEARNAGKLRHPNIVPVHDVGQDKGRDYLVMDLVDGITMGDALRKRPLTYKEKAKLLEKVARAVQYAHEEGVIHRDLKPSNVMLEYRKGGSSAAIQKKKRDHASEPPLGEPQVMDFGLAKDIREGSGITVSGQIMGTPNYMPPEQAEGRTREIGPGSDVYSLGAILYEMLTGLPPFTGENVMQVLKAAVSDDPLPPSRIAPGAPRDLETICLKCLEKDKTRRYASAGDLAEDIRRYLEGEPISARRISVFERFARKIRRNKLLWATGTALAAAIGVGGVTVWVQRREAAVALTKKDVERKESEGRLNRLSTLWMEVILRKQELRALKVPAEQAQGALKVAVDKLGNFIKENPELPQGYYLRARGRLYLDDREGALKDADKALELAPDFTLAVRLGGMIRTEKALSLEIPRTDEMIQEIDRERRELLDRAARDFEGSGEWREEDLKRWGLAPTSDDESMRVVAEAMKRKYAFGDERGAVAYLEDRIRERRQEEYAVLLGHFSKEIKWYDEAVGWAPGYAWAYFVRGITKNERGDAAGAVADYDRAIGIKKDFAQAYINRGNVMMERGDLAEAMADYDRVIGLRKDFAEAYINRGIVMMERGDPEGAIAEYDRAIEIRKDYALAYMNRGIARREKKDAAGAMADFDRAIEIRRDYAQAYLNRGNVRADRGDFAGAIADCDRAIGIKKDYSKAYFNRGNAKSSQGDAAGAIEDFDRAIEIRKDYWEAYTNRGAARRTLGDPAGAIADLDRAIGIRKDNALAYLNRGNAKQERGDVTGAVGDLDRAIEIDPKSPEAYYSRGVAKEKMGDLSGAIVDFDRAIGIRKDYAEAYFDRGNAKKSGGNLAEAIADWTKAIETRKDYAEAYYNRGNARNIRGDVEGAIADWTKAIGIRKNYAEAYANRGNARQGRGDMAGAIADFAEALHVAPSGWPYRSRVEATLKSLRESKPQ